MTMRPTRMLLIALCLLAPAAAALAKPPPPVRITVTFDPPPAIGKVATVTATVSTDFEITDACIRLELPPGIAPAQEDAVLEQPLRLAAGEQAVLRAAVVVGGSGEYCIRARVPGIAGRNLYLVIDEDIAEFSSRSMLAARRAVILARYRRENKLPADADVKFDDLPADVQAQLDALGRVQTAPPEQNVQVKQVRKAEPAEDAPDAQQPVETKDD